MSPRSRYTVSVALVAGAYYVAGRLGLELAYLDGAVAALWPPAGLGLAVLFLYGVRLWPGIAIGDLLLADFSTPLGTVLGQTVGNTLSLVVAALLLRRLGVRGSLERTYDVLALVLCAVVAALVSAAFGPTALRLGDVVSTEELGSVFRTWALSDATGVLVVAPAILTWASNGLRNVRRRDLVEGAIGLVVLAVLAVLAPQRDVPYVVFPVLLWAAVRMGPRGAATAILVISAITVWNTARDEGPFVRGSITDSLLATQFFIATAALTALVLAAVTAERSRAARALKASETVQRELADEQAALRRVATLVAAEAPPRRVFRQVTEEVGRLLALPAAAVVQHDGRLGVAVVAAWSEDGNLPLPVGASLELDSGGGVVAKVLRTGEAQRLESYDEAQGPLAETLREAGYRAAVAAPVTVAGRLWGALVAATAADEPLQRGLEQRLCDFADLVGQALSNADARERLAESRAELVRASDAERRRLERNLHDGAQQRLISVALDLRIAKSKLEAEPGVAREALDAAEEDLSSGLEELRDLARGLHPGLLEDHGLAPALAALLERAPVPVEIEELPEERLTQSVEAAAYYVVAEAVTNVAKYAQASRVTVAVRRANGSATVTVSDDGVGGADPTGGSGLRGLAARVEALNGRLQVDSPPRAGTRIKAEIPVA